MTKTAADGDTAFLGHPRALGYLAFSEAWERFSYYGMQSLLVLYMTKQLLLSPQVDRIAGFLGVERRADHWRTADGQKIAAYQDVEGDGR